MALTADAGVNGFVVERVQFCGAQAHRGSRSELMRRAERGLQIFARASAGKEKSSIAKFAPGIEINGAASALDIGTKRATFVRTLMPTDSEPAKVIERGISIHGSTAVWIEIFHAQDQGAASVPRSLPSRPKGARMTDVQVSGRRRCKSSAIIGHRS
jgi:hypothetical protein